MKRISSRATVLAWIASSLWSASAIASDSVVFVTGNPFDVQDPGLKQALTEFRAEVTSTYKDRVSFAVMHNSKWQDVCDRIRGERKTDSQGRTVIIGHSFGASVTISIAECLAKSGLDIDLFVSIDSIHKWGQPADDVIPTSIRINHSYYQTQDSWLRGAPNHRRADGSYDGITNSHITVPNASGAHTGEAIQILRDGTVRRNLAEIL